MLQPKASKRVLRNQAVDPSLRPVWDAVARSSAPCPKKVDRVTLLIGSLGVGGAERVISMMANYWVEHGRDVTIITLSGLERDWFPLDRRVKRVGLATMGPSRNVVVAGWKNLQRILRLREAIRRSEPQTIISFIDTLNVLTLFATRGLRVPVVVSERTAVQAHRLAEPWNSFRRQAYRWADALVVQTSAVAQWAEVNLRSRTIVAIPNPVEAPDFIAPSSPKRHPTIVAIGRLELVKGFDLLLRALCKPFRAYPAWRLVVLGEGPERSNLVRLAQKLGLDDRIEFRGWHSRPHDVLKDASLFVLPSRYEGFPNALCEAMASGVPAVAFDCPSGPAEIIRNGIDGLLVPPANVDAFSDALVSMMSDDKQRTQMASRAVEVAERFGLGRVMPMWDELIAKVRVRYDCAHR